MQTTEPAYELIWRGRTHLGSKPGTYGDACYAGLCADWPFTLHKYDPKDRAGGNLRLRLEGEDIEVFPPYPGHRITVARYLPDGPGDDQLTWHKIILEPAAEPRLTANHIELSLSLPGEDHTIFVSVRVEIDTTMHPGLSDELVVTRLMLCSTTYYASLGFVFDEHLRPFPH